MSPEALIAWRKRLDLTQTAAAIALGCSRRSLHTWERGETEIPKYIGLACAAIALGVTEYPEPLQS
jgi:transcriptional regulator with XRE-family HTH domain